MVGSCTERDNSSRGEGPTDLLKMNETIHPIGTDEPYVSSLGKGQLVVALKSFL